MRAMKGWMKRGSVLMMLALVLVDGLGVQALTAAPSAWYLVSGITTLALVAMFFYYSKNADKNPLRQKPGSFPFHQVPAASALTLQRAAERDGSVDPAQANIFALAVTVPSAVRQRVVEDYEPDRRTLHQTVSIEAQIPRQLLRNGEEEPPDTIFIPALLAPKGELQDAFDVLADGGSSAFVLSYREYLHLAADILHVLLTAAYDLNRSDRLPPRVREAEALAIGAMMARVDPNATATSVDYSAAQKIEHLMAPNRAVCNLAATFVRKLTTHYAIVAMIPSHSDGRLLFKYRQTLIPGVKLSEADTEKRLTLGGWIRLALGAKPVEVSIELDNASTCQSYHLRIAGPPGLYLASQTPVDVEANGILGRLAKGAPTPPHCRFRRRLGQPHAHFYARYFPEKEPDKERPRIRFKYFEMPPGSPFRAAITALACLALVWLTGTTSIISSAAPPLTGLPMDPHSDIPALLLAFPALAATWLGFESPSGRLFEGTLSARLCLMITAALSISASGLFILRNVLGSVHSWMGLPFNLTFMGESDLAWSILTILALLNFLHIGYKSYIATWHYAYLSSRESE